MSLLLNILLSVLPFGSPVHVPVQLAGNFGEPRPNHIHGGIDIKTEREENLGVYSIADGYISGAVIEKYGYGHALLVTHPNGYTSYYLHLNRFSPQIEAAVRKWQYQHQQFACDIKFRPGEFPVKKGQFIALSGNTGSSQGPHIHLEMHKTKDNNLCDPLNFLKSIVKDRTAPAVYAFKSYPQPGEGVFQHTSESRIFTFDKGYFHAWGKVGFGVRANDHMDSVYNNYGIRYTKLYCDGKLVFASDMDNFPTSCHRMVNSWGDYDHFLSTRIWFMKSYIEPGNTIPIFRTGTNKGIINFNQRRDYRLRYVLSDIFGNQTVKEFTVRGEPEAIPKIARPEGATPLYYAKDNQFETDGVRLNIPKGLLAKNSWLQLQHGFTGNSLSKCYSFSKAALPLFNYAQLSIKPTGKIRNPEKLYIAMRSSMNADTPAAYCGGTYADGWVTGLIRELACVYFIASDETSPMITETSLNPRSLIFKITDTGSGLKEYKTYLDGKFILLKFGKNKEVFFCNLADTPIRPTGKERTLKVIATDNRNNKQEYLTKIKY